MFIVGLMLGAAFGVCIMMILKTSSGGADFCPYCDRMLETFVTKEENPVICQTNLANNDDNSGCDRYERATMIRNRRASLTVIQND